MAGSDYGYFFPSENGDRKYDADSFPDWLRKFFTSGVFENELYVESAGSMNITLYKGYVNISGRVRNFKQDMEFTLEAANSTYPRIDTVVLELNYTDRQIAAKVVTGQYSADTPSATAPVRTDSVYQLVVAQIYVGAGVTAVTQADITDTRTNTDICGYVASTVTEMDFSQFSAQFAAYYEEFVTENEADFTDWVAGLHDILDSETAGHLQLEIEALQQDVGALEEAMEIRVARNLTIPAGSTSYTVTDSHITANEYDCNVQVMYTKASKAVVSEVGSEETQYDGYLLIEFESALPSAVNIANVTVKLF